MYFPTEFSNNPELFISQISDDRTEIRLKSINISSDDLINQGNTLITELEKNTEQKYFILNFENNLPYVQLLNIHQPENSKNICDPTSIFEINNKKYLVTAESENMWFCEQDYITNIYEIIENN